ncbi:MAG: glycoside hydrolase family 25 protein [Clostridiales bacterium]|nr:glycoside hydrolase family 25 protein [Clostridiales bacterium]
MKKLICLLSAAALLCSALLCGCSSGETSQAESVTYASATDTTVTTTGEKIHINDSTLGEIWITVLEDVPVNTLDNSAFTADSTFKYYSENGKAASKEGVDVSSYNGEIDWEKVADCGVDFAMIRIGGRGYGDDGELYADETAVENLTEAKKAGIDVGVYFFSQAITAEEAVEEADYVQTLLGDIKLDYPVAYDWEIIKDDEARTDGVSAAQATQCARAFCDRVASNGYTPMIYSPSQELYFKYDLQQLSDIDIWYCEYADTPTFYNQFSMWQYSSTATVDGIDGETDLNICFTSIADYD